MDNFVTQLKNNININPEKDGQIRRGKIREILYYISISNPKVRIVNKCSEDGDIKFEVPMASIGITDDLWGKYNKEICSDFMANFLGELVIRENINYFAKILTDIHPNVYPSIVNKFEHHDFGMDIYRDKLVFTFHASLLQDILLEDIKRQMS